MSQGLHVLTDDQIRELLENLTLDELESFRTELRGTLHEYSTGTNVTDAGLLHQPERVSVNSGVTGTTTLFMPSTGPGGHAVKVITLSSSSAQHVDDPRPRVPPTGAITLFAASGAPVGILHASTLTAFRTALASACLLIRRNKVHTLTVFGSGSQAYWHIRLALMLRGTTIRKVNIINRRFSDGCKLVLKRFYNTPTATKEREGWRDATFHVLTPGYGEYPRLLEQQVLAADVIFCCTPSTEPLFDGGILTSRDGRRKGRLIVAIGSYTTEMRELPVELLLQATRAHEGHFHYHKHAVEGGVVVVDTLDGALKEAGEIIEAGLQPKQLVELGELVMLQKIVMAEDEESDTSSILSTPGSADRSDLTASSSSAMSSVFGGSSKRSSSLSRESASRTPSPSNRKSGKLPLPFHRRSSSRGDVGGKHSEKEDHLARWLQGGNVIYKSVGLGLMDLAVGIKLIQFAKEKGIGTHVDGF
ncbi:UbiD family decarboxylase [Coniochaeta ligniaria NRRL 30616]|uniref:UbiD family decarboxylase n=1 Tax=Coniochaeta ligniaria NRRL 30616 TaxID=1408157 RepID=A0A1J7JA78_9PEZI|nr:UbiD family decarboxylase [Coniochaeta ligniaria NRRL 30616]